MQWPKYPCPYIKMDCSSAYIRDNEYECSAIRCPRHPFRNDLDLIPGAKERQRQLGLDILERRYQHD